MASLALVGLCASLAHARSAPAPTTTLVSVNATGTDSGDSLSFGSSISANGRLVAFGSNADDLVPNDSNGHDDIFVRNLKTRTTRLVSVNQAGTGSGDGESYRGIITPNGRFVVFLSTAGNLVPNDTNGLTDVFLRNLRTGKTRMVSVNQAGTDGGDGLSFAASVNPNGRFVAFESYATDLVSQTENGFAAVFVRDMRRRQTQMVSVNQAGTANGNGDAGIPTLTPDGRFVAFESTASDLVPLSDSNGVDDVFVRNLRKGTTTLVSVNQAGTGAGDALSEAPVISTNGRLVMFESDADDLVATDTNGFYDVFVRDLK